MWGAGEQIERSNGSARRNSLDIDSRKYDTVASVVNVLAYTALVVVPQER